MKIYSMVGIVLFCMSLLVNAETVTKESLQNDLKDETKPLTMDLVIKISTVVGLGKL
jgi:hypothetical protein